MFRAILDAIASISRFLIAAPLFAAAAAWDITSRLHTLLWPKQPAQADEPSDFAQDLLDADDDLFADTCETLSETELNDFPIGNICRMWAFDRLGRWADDEVDISELPLHQQAWLMSLTEKQLDHLCEEMRPSEIERHVLAKDFTDRDPGLPAVVGPEAVKHLTRRAVQAPKQQPRAAAMDVPDEDLAYAPAPRF